MSGIEVAGIVLGILPILIEAINGYKKGLSKSKILFRKAKIVDKFASALLLQQQTIAGLLQSILLDSGCDVSEVQLDVAPHESLSNPNVGHKVFDYLGTKNSEALFAIIRQADEAVRRIAGHLEGILPDTKDPTTDIVHLVEAYRTSPPKLGFLHSVRLMFSVSELKESTQELDSLVTSFIHFENVVSRTRTRQPLQTQVSKKSTKMSKFFWQIRRLAVQLYLAIFRAWSKNCHPCHVVGLSLEDRIDKMAMLSSLSTAAADTGDIFSLALMSGLSLERATWLKTQCRVTRQLISDESSEGEEMPNPFDDNQRLRSFDDDQKSSKQVVIVTPLADDFSATPKIQIKDICSFLHKTVNGEDNLALLLGKGTQLAEMTTEAKSCHHHDKTDTVSLKEMLGGRSSVKIPLRKRMTLALQLATNYLQLSQTEWWPAAWSKDNIFFFKDDSTTGQAHKYDAFVLLDCKTAMSTGGDTNGKNEQRSSILELGIILLELWHNKTLEDHFELPETPKDYYRRSELALRWLDDGDQPLELYDKAVSHCVKGVVGNEFRLPAHTDSKYWNSFCEDIIRCLYDNCKQWR